MLATNCGDPITKSARVARTGSPTGSLAREGCTLPQQRLYSLHTATTRTICAALQMTVASGADDTLSQEQVVKELASVLASGKARRLTEAMREVWRTLPERHSQAAGAQPARVLCE